ncbi:MAG: hypothetical protein HY321_09590 [Armatimonadetes bacterium]|nr:hypothetical protein [Armatimonadota bacterium]
MARTTRGKRRPRAPRERTAPQQREPPGLQAFTADFFALAGCPAQAGDGSLSVDLTPELADLFGRPSLRLAFQAGDRLDPDAQLIQPGSVLLEKMAAYLRQRVGVGLADVPAAVPAEAVIPPEITFACEAELGRVDVQPEEFVTFNFRISYVCDEKNEEILPVAVDSEGQWVEDTELLARLAAAPPAEGPVETSRRALGALHAGAEARARRHAEQSATRFEQETLPRLHREISRLRAFYQAQIHELDPQDERDQDLRDRYERELRLRTEEEILNHRMTVSLSLVNFRVVRVPRARYRVRLERPHARRTHVFERDLATGTLIRPGCEACGTSLTAADLCAGGHLVCPGCVRACALCGRAECAACGVALCERCGRSVCAECRVTCAVCENVVCREHSGACPVCSRPACDACLRECALCHSPQCATHLAACAVCGRLACAACRETCSECGAACCAEHAGTCERCGRVFCTAHLEACESCGARRCSGHLETCSECGRRLCEAHARSCGGCGSPVCEAHVGRCGVCGAEACSVCGPVCAITEVRLCPEHAVVCGVCAETVASTHAATCAVCGTAVCARHAAECEACGRVACERHRSECRMCGAILCGTCGGAGVCGACREADAGEGVPLADVQSIPGLPDAWRAAVARATWRRLPRRERVVYYGSRLFRLLLIVTDTEGRFAEIREFSLMDTHTAGRGW